MEPIALTVEEASSISRVGRNHLYDAIRAGDLKVVRVGRRIVVPIEALRSWLDERTGATVAR